MIEVDSNGSWMLYSPVLPDGATPLGTITRDGYDTGAYVRLQSGVCVQMNAGVSRTLPEPYRSTSGRHYEE